MVHPLVGIHAALGELGIFAFLWVLVELINPTNTRIKRAKIAAILGVIFIFSSWLAGGYYYLNYYGDNVKPLIKEGPNPWAHLIFTETKEHIFLFIPLLSILVLGLIYKNNLLKNNSARKSIIIISALIVLLGLTMAAMGYIISTGARAALEAKVI